MLADAFNRREGDGVDSFMNTWMWQEL
jgi:hypothetical protein